MTTTRPYPSEARSLDEVLIGDGYIYRGYIAAKPRLHGELRYAFRPMLPDAVDATEARIRELHGSRREEDIARASRIVRETIAKHVTWCSATDSELTPDQVNRLPVQIYNRMYLQIIGSAPMDEGDDADDETSSDRLAADVKN